MNSETKFRLVFAFLLVVSEITFGQITPKYSNEFLAIGANARGLALSGAYSGLTSDVSSSYWNPAGLLQVKEKYSASLMHTSLFSGIANYDFASFVTNYGEDNTKKIGFSLLRLGVDDIPDTRFLFTADGQIDYTQVKSFSASDYAFLISYAQEIKKIKGLNLGLNSKVIYRNAGIFANAWGFGIDAGLQYVRNNFHFGLMARDITTTFNVWTINTETIKDVFSSTNNIIPTNSLEITLPKLQWNAAYTWKYEEQFSVTPTLGFDMTFDGKRNTVFKSDFASIAPAAGLELGYKNLVFIRTGIGGFQQVKDFKGNLSYVSSPSAGVGLRLKDFTLDYALVNLNGSQSNLLTHIFSVVYNFNQIKL